MISPLPIFPFEENRLIGTITEVTASKATVNLPFAAKKDPLVYHGNIIHGGSVGEYVVIENEDVAIFGKIIEVMLPERERLTVEPKLGKTDITHPIGKIQLLANIPLQTGIVEPGLSIYPRLANRVFSAHPELIKWIAEASQRTEETADPITLDLAHLPEYKETIISITPERLFGCHCAVLGTTGAGKSWTVAKLIEETGKHNSKVILFDATGEFHTLGDYAKHVSLGGEDKSHAETTEVVFPYSNLVQQDIFAIFTPSGQVQGPRLREALQSLKLAKVLGETAPLVEDGCIPKAGKQKAPFDAAYRQHYQKINSPEADFDIFKLSKQINHECVWPSGGSANNPDYSRWGNSNEQHLNWCTSLILRIDNYTSSSEFSCIFCQDQTTDIVGVINDFIENADQSVLRISLKLLPFAMDIRPIVVNAIARHLLSKAREKEFINKPLVIFLDEAHQFVNKKVGDEFFNMQLDACELIAKEGRKYGLLICMATQRPRDIPEGVLSQMGTMIVHRLVHPADREIVTKASSQIDRPFTDMLPEFTPGEALIIGSDFPIPLTVKIEKPSRKPESKGPDFQKHWGGKI